MPDGAGAGAGAGPSVTVAIPLLDGGELFASVLRALARQTVAHELLVCDSGSRDGSRERAEAHGARVIDIAAHEFNHGAVRNRLMQEAAGDHVALLTQDAEPIDERWLERLLGGFSLAEDVGAVCGPYVARPDAPLPVRLELERFFASLSPDGEARVERLEQHERDIPATSLVGGRGFFTDANACVARWAWERVRYPDVAYAEDRGLALRLLRAGYAKAFVPGAAVVHSHSYTSSQQLRRCFDEWRGLLEVYGWREPLSPARMMRQLRGELAYARRELGRAGIGGSRQLPALAGVAAHRLTCTAGALLGSRADRLPRAARRMLSLDRSEFAPVPGAHARMPAPAPPPQAR